MEQLRRERELEEQESRRVNAEMQRKLGLAAEAQPLSPRVAQVQKTVPLKRTQASPEKSPRQFTQFHSVQVLKSAQAEPETVIESERP